MRQVRSRGVWFCKSCYDTFVEPETDPLFHYHECLAPAPLRGDTFLVLDDLRRLDGKEADIFESRYICQWTLQEIGDQYRISRERVRQILDKALRKLRHPDNWRFNTDGLIEQFAGFNAGKVLDHLRKTGRLSGPCLTEHPLTKANRLWAELYEREREKKAKLDEKERHRIWDNRKNPEATYYEDRIAIDTRAKEPLFEQPEPVYSVDAAGRRYYNRPRTLGPQILSALARTGWQRTDVGTFRKNGTILKTCHHVYKPDRFVITIEPADFT